VGAPQAIHTIFVLLNLGLWGAKTATSSLFPCAESTTAKITRSVMKCLGGNEAELIPCPLPTGYGRSAAVSRISHARATTGTTATSAMLERTLFKFSAAQILHVKVRTHANTACTTQNLRVEKSHPRKFCVANQRLSGCRLSGSYFAAAIAWFEESYVGAGKSYLQLCRRRISKLVGFAM